MELTAAIEALTALKRPCRVQLHSDSKYVIQGITSWIHNWKRKNWMRGNQPVFGAMGLGMLDQRAGGLRVAEYAPNAVKKAVIGVGHGEKAQIHMMVKVLMPKASFDSDDAADALAIAICHAHHRQSAAGRLAAAALAAAG